MNLMKKEEIQEYFIDRGYFLLGLYRSKRRINFLVQLNGMGSRHATVRIPEETQLQALVPVLRDVIQDMIQDMTMIYHTRTTTCAFVHCQE